MKCIIVDDEPLAREAIKILIEENKKLTLMGAFNNATSASEYIQENPVDLIFLDIRMPNVTGLEFARTIPKSTLIIFTTAHTEYALDSYEVDAIDYLVKPVFPDRFHIAVDKALSYHNLINNEVEEKIENIDSEFIFVKSERKFFKVNFDSILFVEGLKDYVVIQMKENKIITRSNLKNFYELLPRSTFLRINKSYIVNTNHINSFDNNDIYIDKHVVAIGNNYRDIFYNEFVSRMM